MTARTNNTTSVSTGTLAVLRALAIEPSQPLIHLLHAAGDQAELLRRLLPTSPVLILEYLPVLFPSIVIEYVDTMPVPGISFWGNNRWHIHIRTSDPVDVRQLTALHELKHIIDHPLRRQQPDPLTDGDWEALADCFAAGVLAPKPRLVTALGERGDTDD